MVSTVIPVHNRPALLQEAVASVLRQTYRPIEIVIVNDGSTDETAEMADSIVADHPGEVRAYHQPNRGPGLARETGRQNARGEFIQYLDSDDLLLPRKFEWQVAALRRYADCGIAYGKTIFRSPNSMQVQEPWKRTGERIETMFPAFLNSRWWGTSTPLYRRSVCDAAGAWLGLSNEEDWEYDCRIAADGVRLAFVDEFVSEERDHSGQRLSRGGSVVPSKLRDRAQAHALILEHACRAGIRADDPHMQQFARALFLLARQCGAAGLTAESRKLFDLAKSASGHERAGHFDFKLYELAARTVGWSRVGWLACSLDRLRP